LPREKGDTYGRKITPYLERVQIKNGRILNKLNIGAISNSF